MIIEMKLYTLVILLLAYGNCQLIFPDEYESTRSPILYEITRRPRPFPTLQIPIVTPSINDISTLIYPDNNYKKIAAASALGGVSQSFVPSLSMPNAIINDEKSWINHVKNILASGVTKFTLNMNNAINKMEKVPSTSTDNIVFSPINIVGTLTMILLASAGRTFNETVNLLGLNLDFDISRHSEMVHEIFGLLFNSIVSKSILTMNQSINNNTDIFIAGGIFIQDGYPIRREFRSIVENIYKSDVITVNFQRNSDMAKDIINNWINVKTNGKINNLLVESPDEYTKIILASALYFNGEWNQHFIKGATKTKPFFMASGETIYIDMMYNGGTFLFYEDKQLGVKILGLPYKNNNNENINLDESDNNNFHTTMYILLPTSSNVNALNDLQLHLTADIIEQLIDNMKKEVCIIGIPRMKLSNTMNLNYILQYLGLTSLFNSDTSNLGLLSTGLNTTFVNSYNDNPVFFPRINTDESPTTIHTPNNTFKQKKNYITYEDSNGGYIVEQWNSGVHLEKIHNVNQRKRRSPNNINNNRIIYKRQIQSSINNNYDRFINSDKYKVYGLDALRNSVNVINPRLYASDVLHKVEIDITETGTVAAAATGVIIQRNGNQKRIIANRPFLLFIRHNPTKLILFWSTVNKPTPNYT